MKRFLTAALREAAAALRAAYARLKSRPGTLIPLIATPLLLLLLDVPYQDDPDIVSLLVELVRFLVAAAGAAFFAELFMRDGRRESRAEFLDRVLLLTGVIFAWHAALGTALVILQRPVADSIDGLMTLLWLIATDSLKNFGMVALAFALSAAAKSVHARRTATPEELHALPRHGLRKSLASSFANLNRQRRLVVGLTIIACLVEWTIRFASGFTDSALLEIFASALGTALVLGGGITAAEAAP